MLKGKYNYTRGRAHGHRDLHALAVMVSAHSVDHSALVCSDTNSHETANGNVSEEWHVNPPVGRKMQVTTPTRVRGREWHWGGRRSSFICAILHIYISRSLQSNAESNFMNVRSQFSYR